MGFELPLSTQPGGWGLRPGWRGLHIEFCCFAGRPLLHGKAINLTPAFASLAVGMGSTRSVCLCCTEREQDAPEEKTCFGEMLALASALAGVGEHRPQSSSLLRPEPESGFKQHGSVLGMVGCGKHGDGPVSFLPRPISYDNH